MYVQIHPFARLNTSKMMKFDSGSLWYLENENPSTTESWTDENVDLKNPRYEEEKKIHNFALRPFCQIRGRAPLNQDKCTLEITYWIGEYKKKHGLIQARRHAWGAGGQLPYDFPSVICLSAQRSVMYVDDDTTLPHYENVSVSPSLLSEFFWAGIEAFCPPPPNQTTWRRPWSYLTHFIFVNMYPELFVDT